MCLHLTKVEDYLVRWNGVSILAAAQMLVKIGCGDQHVWWKHKEKTPKEIIQSEKYHSGPDNWQLARDSAVCQFWGGPPNRIKFVTGTYLTFLVDRLLFNDYFMAGTYGKRGC